MYTNFNMKWLWIDVRSVENANTKLCATWRNQHGLVKITHFAYELISFFMYILFYHHDSKSSVTLALANNRLSGSKSECDGNEAFCLNISVSEWVKITGSTNEIYIAFEQLNHAHNDDISSLLCVWQFEFVVVIFLQFACVCVRWYVERTKATTFCLHYSMSADLMAYCYNHHNNVKRSIFYTSIFWVWSWSRSWCTTFIQKAHICRL